MQYIYTIHQRAFYDSYPLGTPVDLTQTTYFDLPHLHVVHVKGEALTFLQGQLTCDVKKIPPQQSCQGALCNLKGRIVALMEVVRFQEDVLLIFPEDLTPLIQKTWQFAAQLSHIRFEKSPLHCYGLYALQPPVDTDGVYYAIVPQLYLCLSHQKIPTQRGNFPWHQLCLQVQRFSIYPETTALFLPQDVNLDQTNTVSFTKGCYRGQEIIARMHYRGLKKYTLKTLNYPSASPLKPGQTITLPQDEQGEIVDLCPLPHQAFLLNICVRTVLLQ